MAQVKVFMPTFAGGFLLLNCFLNCAQDAAAYGWEVSEKRQHNWAKMVEGIQVCLPVCSVGLSTHIFPRRRFAEASVNFACLSLLCVACAAIPLLCLGCGIAPPCSRVSLLTYWRLSPFIT